MEKFFVDAPGARLYVEDTGGTGVPVVLAHAKSGNALVWHHQQQAFAAAGYRVVAWSRRGSAPTEILDAEIAASDAGDIDVIADTLRLGRFHALGTAAGGGVMLRYAVTRPQRIRTLIVANSLGDIAEEDYRRRSEALRPPPFGDLPVEVRELGPFYRAANREGMAEWLGLVGKPCVPGVAPTSGVLWSDLSRLTMPVLWLTGDADLYMPPPLLREFQSRVAGSALSVIENAGHSAFWEQPEAFNAAVLSFIKTCDSDFAMESPLT
jgi:pimeloyl-ACP methyl ester carboxylesterase